MSSTLLSLNIDVIIPKLLQDFVDDPEAYTIVSKAYLQNLQDTSLYMEATENAGALDVLEPMLDVVNEEYKQLKLDWENEQNGN
jgi:hypothetical protein